MNKIKFENYLKQYLFYVSGCKTLSIHYLLKKSKQNKRIIDPLILYCALTNKEKILLKYDENYTQIIQQVKRANFQYEQFGDYSFYKIYDSYLHKINVNEYDRKIKEKMRINILELQKKKRVSTYWIYHSLNLNPGNINDYLKNNNTSKLSVETAKKIEQLLLSY